MSALTDWSDGEITELMAERDEARHMVAEMRAALIIGRDIVIETSSNNRHNKFVEYAYDVIEASAHVAGRWCLASERDAAIRERDEALRQLESSRLCVRSLTDTKQAVAEMRAAANDAMTEVQREEALAILRDMVTSWDGVDDFDCEIIVPPARKLLGDI